MTAPSSKPLESLRGSETIVPARSPPNLPAFPKCHFPAHGTNILLIIPTGNADKAKVLKDYIEARAPSGVQVHTETVPVESDVGEQPYNDAGAIGAFNRISNALRKLLQDAQFPQILEKNNIGTVVVGAIENFIQTRDVDRPADYAVAIVNNATADETVTACSRGVTLDPEYINWAAAFGYEGDNQDHGKVTVGNVLAAKFPGLDPKNWHDVLAGVSRYTLLAEALGNASISWW